MLINGPTLKGARHLHETSNESIIFMSHFSIGIIDIHTKISLGKKFQIQNGPRCCGLKMEKKLRRRLLKKKFMQSLIILHVVSVGVTLETEPTIS